MNLAAILLVFFWRRIYSAEAARGGKGAFSDKLVAWFYPLKTPYVAYARLASEVAATACLSVYIQAVYADGRLGAAERYGLATAALFETLGILYRGGGGDREFVSLGSAVALAFASGLVSSFSGPSEWEDRFVWLWFPTLHAAVFHCTVRLYLIKS